MKIGGDGRPRKHTREEQRIHAKCFLDIKKREPQVTQDSYAANYGISGRTLRRYIERYFALEALLIKEAELNLKKDKLQQKRTKDISISENKKEDSGLTVLWT
jgi:hypothetical protein